MRGVRLAPEVAAALAEEDGQPTPAAEGVEAFFEMFVSSLTGDVAEAAALCVQAAASCLQAAASYLQVSSLTGGAMFQRLSPEQQAVASEKVRAT